MMLRKFFVLIIAVMLFACGQDKQQDTAKASDAASRHDSLLNAIHNTEEAIRNNMKVAVLDPRLAGDAVNGYTLFARAFPHDTNSAMFLFRAADIYANAMKQYDQSLATLEKITLEYPEFRKLPLCYFQMAVIYDDNLNDDAKAKIYYERFLEKFPNHPLVPQVKSLISYLGKSNEELLKEFEKKNNKK